jgi:copper(I)-binding protein
MLERRLLLALATIGFGSALATPPVAAQMAARNGIMIEHPWARATPTTSLSSVVYLTIVNNHRDDTLVHASTPIATMATLHQTRLDNGIMRMLPIEAIPIAEGERLMLKPGGYHIMLTGLMKPLKPGTYFPLTLTFANAGAITVRVRVEKAGASGTEDSDAPAEKKPGGSKGDDSDTDDEMGGMKMP